MTSHSSITTKDKLSCVERELRMREKVYARLVATGKMSEKKADYEIEIMKEIVADYLKLIRSEQLL